jgi:hypothetical protein
VPKTTKGKSKRKKKAGEISSSLFAEASLRLREVIESSRHQYVLLEKLLAPSSAPDTSVQTHQD